MEITDRIKECAKIKRLSISAICAEIGMSRGYIRDVEAGKSKIPPERLEKIAEFLNVTPEYLRGETEEKNKPVIVVESEPDNLDNDIQIIAQFYKGFSDEQRKELMAEILRIWQGKRNES